ncbi:MAG: hypothetical protein AABY04_03085, partial [Candidatus Micrarchaeota archaeon]
NVFPKKQDPSAKEVDGLQLRLMYMNKTNSNPKAKAAYLKRLKKIRAARFVKVKDFSKRYGLDAHL